MPGPSLAPTRARTAANFAVAIATTWCSATALVACTRGPTSMNPDPVPCPDDAAPFDVPDGWAPDVPCDGDRPNLVDAGVFTGATAVIIAADGTMYYTQPFAVGRWIHGSTEVDRWVEFPNGTMLTALALRPSTHQLFVAASDHAVYALDLTQDPPTPTVYVADAGLPNGLTISSCGDLFYTDLSEGNVFWVDTTGTATRVNTMGPIAQPAGLAFGPDDALYVTSVGEGSVKRFELLGNLETSRTTVLSSTSMTSNADAGVGAPHGIAFDYTGRIYVTDQTRRSLLRFNLDGSHGSQVMGNLPLGGGLDFGAGPLDCGDVYVANSGTLQRFQAGNIPGANVPWHQ